MKIARCQLMAALLGALALLSHGRALAQATVPGVDPELATLLARCAPTVHPETMAAVVSAESRGHQFAIADAGPVKLPWSQRKALVRSFYPSTPEEAVKAAETLIANGHTVSLGVAQVNDRNLARLGVSIKDMFDPCMNVAAGGKILTDFYTKAVKKFGDGPAALHAALSAYNSGDWVRGAKDGYVDLVYKQIGKPLAIRQERAVPRLSSRAGPASTRATPNRVVTVGDPPTQKNFTMKASNFSVAEMH